MSNTFATPRTVALQALLSMEFSRQENWGRLPFPSPEDLPDPGIKPASSASAGGFFTPDPPRSPYFDPFSSYTVCNINLLDDHSLNYQERLTTRNDLVI